MKSNPKIWAWSRQHRAYLQTSDFESFIVMLKVAFEYRRGVCLPSRVLLPGSLVLCDVYRMCFSSPDFCNVSQPTHPSPMSCVSSYSFLRPIIRSSLAVILSCVPSIPYPTHYKHCDILCPLVFTAPPPLLSKLTVAFCVPFSFPFQSFTVFLSSTSVFSTSAHYCFVSCITLLAFQSS